jgi:hypothetical protein
MSTKPKTSLASSAVMESVASANLTNGPLRDGADSLPGKMARRSARSGNLLELAIEPQELCTVFGVEDADVATRLLSQLVNVLNPAAGDAIDAAVINEVIALVRGIGPAGALEAMTVTLLVGAQHAALDCMRRATHPDQTPGGRSMYFSLGLKSARTYSQLLEALNHGRGKGQTRQEIVVTHVSVEAGGQAIVGTVTPGRG